MGENKLTGTEQIGVLQSLSQQAAAWLLNLNGRSLRDRPDIPRNINGEYDARRLLEWAAGRLPEPNLTDADQERLLTIGEHYTGECSFACKAIADFGKDLEAKYGDAGLAVLARALLDACREAVALDPAYYQEPTAAELRREAEELVDQRRMDQARQRLDVSVVCETCRRLRRGPKWVKADPPAGFVVIKGVCPSCEARE